MRCSACGTENPAAAKFCEECGVRLARACPHCGHEVGRQAKFCAECGQALTTAATPAEHRAAPHEYTPQHLAEKILACRAVLEGERKQVTVLFADIVGSTELIRDLDPEAARTLLDGAAEMEERGAIVTELPLNTPPEQFGGSLLGDIVSELTTPTFSSAPDTGSSRLAAGRTRWRLPFRPAPGECRGMGAAAV